MKMGYVELRVKEASQQHVGKGVAVVHPDMMAEQNWTSGQVIEIGQQKKTHALVWPAASKQDKSIIRIDGATRYNAGAGIGDKVSVKAADAAQAEQVVLSPTEKIAAEGLQEYMRYHYSNHVLTTGDAITAGTQMGGRIQFFVTSTKPSRPVIVTDDTAFKLGNARPERPVVPRVTYDELGGLQAEVQKIREMVELPMRHPELFEKIGIEAPKGVLLYGPPGTGKTLLARAVASETNAHFISLSGPEIMAKHYGESEERVRDIFKQAEESAPSIIFIDEIDSIAPKREEVTGELEKRIVSQLLSLMDGMKSRGKVVVIAATNRPDSIDPALRRPGRFDREIEIGIPNDAGRLEILNIHTRGMPLAADADLKEMARVTHGFVGADLEALTKEAAMRSLRRILPEIDLDQEKISPAALQKIKVTQADLADSLKDVRPSALREVLVQAPDVSWDDIGGLDEIKTELREAVEWPLKHGEAYRHADVRAPKGILLHGPPGTGKTLLAKAVAKMTESNFISVKGPELLSKWVGESEKGVREVFRKARLAAPCIIFFDEIESLVPRRGSGDSSHVSDNVVSQVLTEIDGLEELHNVLIIGATNRLDIVDKALLRPGRFDRIIKVPNPDKESRYRILKIHTRKKPLIEGLTFNELTDLTENMSGAEIASAANEAAKEVLRRYIASGKNDLQAMVIKNQDIKAAVEKVKAQGVL